LRALRKPLVRRRAGGTGEVGVERDQVPSGGDVDAVVVRRTLPVVEVARSLPSLVLVVADRRIRDRAELAVEGTAARAVPVEELRRRALLVDVAEIQEHVRVPARDQVRGGGGAGLTAGAVADGRQHERAAAGRRTGGGREAG